MAIPSRAMRIGLIASLALNVFLIAAGATWWARRPPESIEGHAATDATLPSPRRLMFALDHDDRVKLETLMKDKRAPMRSAIGELLVARDDLAATLRAEPYDRAAAESAFKVLRDKSESLAAHAQGLILDLADAVDAHGRGRIADTVDSEHREWRRRAHPEHHHREMTPEQRERNEQRRRERAEQRKAKEQAASTPESPAPAKDSDDDTTAH